MATQQYKSPLEQAGLRSLQSNYNDKNIQPHQQQISYARNFKLRLLNVDPQQQKNRQNLKENYKKQLQKQMEEQRKRKQQQKNRIKEQQMKQQQKFYQKIKIQSSNSNKKQQQPYFIMRSAQRNRNSTQRKTTLEDVRPEQQPLKNSSNKYSTPYIQNKQINEIKPLPNLMQQMKEHRKPIIDNIENQRMASIQQFQDNMIRRMQDLKLQIKKTSSQLQVDRQINRIRNLLKQKPIYGNLQNSQMIGQLTDSLNPFYEFSKRSRVFTNIQQKKQSRILNNSRFQKINGQSQIQYQYQNRFNPPKQDINHSSLSYHSGYNNNNSNKRKRLSTQSENLSEQQLDKVDIIQIPVSNKQYKQLNSINEFKMVNQKRRNKYQNESMKQQMVNQKIDNTLNNLDNLLQQYERS